MKKIDHFYFTKIKYFWLSQHQKENENKINQKHCENIFSINYLYTINI